LKIAEWKGRTRTAREERVLNWEGQQEREGGRELLGARVFFGAAENHLENFFFKIPSQQM